ncbi:MAG TPA: hypothetical protein VGC37_16230 [Friedmanniella sp.]
MTRDAWADAHQAATADVLDDDLAAVRRRLWLRRALVLVLVLAALLAAFWLIGFVIDPDDVSDVWPTPLPPRWVTFSLMALAMVLVIAGGIRSIGSSQPFVAPDAFLSRTDRAWLRTQVAGGRPVPEERRAVVAQAARAMLAEGRRFPTNLGLVVLYLAIIVGGSSFGTLVTFSALIVVMLVRTVRGAVWSRRARRWLAQHG